MDPYWKSLPYQFRCVDDGTHSSHFQIKFGKNSKTNPCELMKNLYHLAKLAHLRMFTWKIFISFWLNLSNSNWNPTYKSFLKNVRSNVYRQVAIAFASNICWKKLDSQYHFKLRCDKRCKFKNLWRHLTREPF